MGNKKFRKLLKYDPASIYIYIHIYTCAYAQTNRKKEVTKSILFMICQLLKQFQINIIVIGKLKKKSTSDLWLYIYIYIEMYSLQHIPKYGHNIVLLKKRTQHIFHNNYYLHSSRIKKNLL